MPHWSRKVLRSVSTALAAVLTGLWFAGACAVAPLPCAMPCAGGDASHEMTLPCEQATAACELQAFNAPPVSAFDFPMTPVLFPTWPVGFVGAKLVRTPPVSWQATRPPSTPLYLTHLALLN